MRRAQLSFGDGLIADEVDDLCEEWMKHADQVLTDDQIVTAVYEALAKRHPKSRSRGRLGAPAEVVLRLLLLKHVRNWSYQVLEREVRANLVYRDFTRVGAGKTPDAKTMGRWGVALGPEAIKQIHERIVQIAQGNGLVQGRRMRVDTTVVETNIHYPTDSSLLGDGVRVLIRTMRKITKIAGEAGAKLCDRSRSVKLRVLDIARAARAKGKPHKERLERAYGKLLNSTSRVVGQAKRFSEEIAEGVKRSTDILKQLALEGLRRELDEMLPRVKQVMKQTRARIFSGDTRSEGKLLSLFEPSTEIIRKGKAGKPNEFGKMVKLQEAENQIVIDYDVYARRPSDSDLLIAAIETHRARLGRTPHLVAADAAFYSSRNEAAAKQMGVKRVCIPNRATKSPDRKREQKKRWFRNGQKWRTGCEGRISVVKRRHGLNRCRYKGETGMKRWVGLGVIADNLVNIGREMKIQAAP
ncbi:MAG TPA: ISNCY family transposase [Burkholderiales bacterium]|nr:ISNCY family transposase [Burkholderiales bacterium]